jgi:hypothetical protein
VLQGKDRKSSKKFTLGNHAVPYFMIPSLQMILRFLGRHRYTSNSRTMAWDHFFLKLSCNLSTEMCVILPWIIVPLPRLTEMYRNKDCWEHLWSFFQDMWSSLLWMKRSITLNKSQLWCLWQFPRAKELFTRTRSPIKGYWQHVWVIWLQHDHSHALDSPRNK